MANNIIKEPRIKGIGTKLGTSIGAVYSGQPKTIQYDASAYSFLLVVVHAGNDVTGTWLSSAVFPINIDNLHTSQSALTFSSSGGTTYCDIRVTVSKTQTYAVLDSKSSSIDPYVTVYGIK